jgi:thiamine-phosphate pyrophosphorylase
MDRKLVAWARAVKARRRRARLPGHALPVLWLFTDAARLPDPRAAVARLPRGLCGVVLRHDASPGRARLGAELARLCRARRLTLCIAGDAALAARLGAGLHLRDGRHPPGPRCARVVTSSAHGRADLRRAARAGAALAFLSPVWPTASHPGAPGLGLLRWRTLARQAAIPVCALGGVEAGRVGALRAAIICAGAGAIGALS